MTSAPPPASPVGPPAWQPPPPPPPPDLPAPRQQLYRSRSDKMLGGVCGGLAEYSGIDALLWRVGFVALTFAGGSGVLVYLLLWLLMPADPVGVAAPGRAVAAVARPPAGPRSPVPGVTIAGLLIVVGILVLLMNLTPWDIGARGILGAALLVVGAGLVATAFSNGRRAKGGLIALGAVLSVALLVASAEPWQHGSDMGDRTYRPASAAEVSHVYHGGVGDMTVDLTQVSPAGLDGPVTTRIDHGFGDLQVVVPTSADVRLTVDHGLGDLKVFDRGSAAQGFFPGTG
ncbi:MAG TPA: PspC domain-containing protein, partial [Blastococcus sp.]